MSYTSEQVEAFLDAWSQTPRWREWAPLKREMLKEDVAAAIAAADRAAWQPIETAPRDGTTVFGCNYKLGQRGMVSFNGTEWEMVDGLTNFPMGVGFYPTHWRSLPAAPGEQTSTLSPEDRGRG